MQRDPNPVVITSVPGTSAARPPADVPSEQLWRQAIDAARQAASAAAELRLAIEASRARLRPIVAPAGDAT
jgi:hypothetical protein